MIKDVLLEVMQEDALVVFEHPMQGCRMRGWFFQPNGGFASLFGSMLSGVLPKNMCKVFRVDKRKGKV